MGLKIREPGMDEVMHVGPAIHLFPRPPGKARTRSSNVSERSTPQNLPTPPRPSPHHSHAPRPSRFVNLSIPSTTDESRAPLLLFQVMVVVIRCAEEQPQRLWKEVSRCLPLCFTLPCRGLGLFCHPSPQPLLAVPLEKGSQARSLATLRWSKDSVASPTRSW